MVERGSHPTIIDAPGRLIWQLLAKADQRAPSHAQADQERPGLLLR